MSRASCAIVRSLAAAAFVAAFEGRVATQTTQPTNDAPNP